MPLVTKDKIEKLLAKNLTGFEAAKLVIADSVEVDHGRDGFLSEKDIRQIKAGLFGQEAEIYNAWIEAYRAVSFTLKEALIHTLQATGALNQVTPRVQKFYIDAWIQLVKSHAPAIVTQKQYEDIKARQREYKLQELHTLETVLTSYCYEMAKAESEEDPEPEYGSYDFDAPGLAQDYPELYQAGRAELEGLIQSGRLPLQEEGRPDFDRPETLKDFHVTGAALYAVNHWTKYIDEFETGHQFGLEGEANGYAVLQEEDWWYKTQVDERGYYKDKTFNRSLVKGLEEEALQNTGQTLRENLLDMIGIVRQKVTAFLAIQAVLETLSEIIGVKLTEDLEKDYVFLRGEVETYNGLIKVDSELIPEELSPIYKELRAYNLPTINLDKLKPKASSIKYFRERMAMSLGAKWWELAQDLEFEEDAEYYNWFKEAFNAKK